MTRGQEYVEAYAYLAPVLAGKEQGKEHEEAELAEDIGSGSGI